MNNEEMLATAAKWEKIAEQIEAQRPPVNGLVDLEALGYRYFVAAVRRAVEHGQKCPRVVAYKNISKALVPLGQTLARI